MKYEWRWTKLHHYLLLLLYAAGLAYFAVLVLPMRMGEPQPLTVMNDFIFIVLLSLGVYAPRGYAFFVREVKSQLYAAPLFLQWRPLPVPENVQIVSRMLMSAWWMVMMQLCFLVLLYLFSWMTGVLLPENPLWFAVHWMIACSVFAGMAPASEPGDKMSMLKIVLFCFGVFAGLIILSLAVFFISGGRFIWEWFLAASSSQPLLLTILLLSASTCSNFGWVQYMRHYMKKTNYTV
ncbi:hypothetical protein [Alkalicoccus urumqiensis]|nr:hypothetical protein [Alkalicoccus urumqiensis]